MPEPQTLMTGIVFGESPRWGPDGRLWLADWGTQEVIAVDLQGRREVIARLTLGPFQPISIDWLPDGSLLIVSGRPRRLLRRALDGTLEMDADLSGVSATGWNEIVVDGRGHAYLNNVGFDLAAGEDFVPGTIAVLTPGGAVRQVADGLGFPNGMAVTPDNSTLICAESYGKRLAAFDIAADGSLQNQRVWADLGDGVPDGICLDADGAVWYGDVPNERCVRVRAGGDVLQTIDLDRGCFACMLGGAQRRTLFMVVREWRGPATMAEAAPTGEVRAAEAPAPGVGWP